MNLYKISQDKNDDYDTYDAAIVAAGSSQKASQIHPSGRDWSKHSWCDSLAQVKVEYIGKAAKGTNPGVILASFNAG